MNIKNPIVERRFVMGDLNNRYDFVFLFDVKDGNLSRPEIVDSF